MKLEDIHFHDSVLLRVIEDLSTDDLYMEVDYPIDWENSLYEPRTIVFRDVVNYKIDEIPFEGTPFLLGAYDEGVELGRFKVLIETSAGNRRFHFRTVELLKR
jgi:hypothetical protein